MASITNLNHVAIVVNDIDTALAFWNKGLGIPMTQITNVPAESSRVAFLPINGGEIELVQPTSDETGIGKFLAKKGQGMHHICLEVDDIEKMIAHLLSIGIRMINDVPKITNDGKKYAFIHPESATGVLVELYQLK
ncbi:MAG: methylmalonyl-CoA epimerase [Chloroflexota bacterium]